MVLGGELMPSVIDLALEAPTFMLYAPNTLDSMGTFQWSVVLADLDDDGYDDLCAGSVRNDGGRVDCVLMRW